MKSYSGTDDIFSKVIKILVSSFLSSHTLLSYKHGRGGDRKFLGGARSHFVRVGNVDLNAMKLFSLFLNAVKALLRPGE